MTSVQDLISSRDAAEILNCDVRTISRWSQEGKLPVAVQVPGYRGARLFERSVVEELARRNAEAEPERIEASA